jgi:hypothetical protein
VGKRREKRRGEERRGEEKRRKEKRANYLISSSPARTISLLVNLKSFDC